MKRLLLLASAPVLALAAIGADPEIDLTFYSPLQGLSGAQLKQAIHDLVGPVGNEYTYLTYGNSTTSRKTWWGFYYVDRGENNEVIDRYSDVLHTFGEIGASVSGMNIEHSFAQSWWEGGTSEDSYRDLYNLMPCETTINNAKSNYVMDKVVTVSKTNGVTKVGTAANGYKAWEPADKWKGDFARGYMYMSTAYQHLTWRSEVFNIIGQNEYPTLKEHAYSLYIQWAKQDALDSNEIIRNQAVHEIQGNRNPYVDFPNLMEYVWGDSTDVAFNVLTSVKSAPFSGVVLDPGETPTSLYSCTFLGDEGDCTIENLVLNGVSNVWSITSSYGWKGTAFTNTGNEASSILWTPEIDMSAYATGTLTFSHAVNYAANPQDVLSVVAKASDGTEIELVVPTWPKGNSWSFSNSGNVSLNAMAGKRFKIGFRYTSTTDEAPTWEIRNLAVTAVGRYNGIETIPEYLSPESDDMLAPAEYYNLQGVRVDPSNYRGIVIRRQGSSVTKIIIK